MKNESKEGKMRKVRRVLVAFAIAFAVALAGTPPAVGHGSCSAQASSLQAGPGFVAFTGGATCGSTHGFAVSLRIQRRMPGGAWATVSSRVLSGVAVTSVSGFLQHNAFNCARDYRGQSQGNASPGGHSFNKFGPILNHTC
jgi:hypothetical protein